MMQHRSIRSHKPLQIGAAHSIALIIFAFFSVNFAYADPQASLRWIGGNGPDGCQFHGDGLILSISDQRHQILQKHICSAYGSGDAHIVTDAIGDHYVFLNYAEGHGTHNTTKYLAIYRLTDRLTELENLDVSQPDGMLSWWTYEDTVQLPAAGGLRIMLKLKLYGKPDADMPLPPETKTIDIGSVK